MPENNRKAYIVGIGSGTEEYLTPHAEKIISACGVVVGWESGLEAVRNCVAGKKIFKQDCVNYKVIPYKAADTAKELDTDVAMILLGDPLAYPAGSNSFYKQFAGFEVVLIPAVSSLQLAAAAAMVSLENSRIILYHPDSEGCIDRDDLAKKQKIMLEALKEGYNLIVLSDIEQMPAQTAAFLLENGILPETEVVIGEELGLAGERITRLSLSEVIRFDSSWMSTIIVKA